jgi:hypothetical protein
MQIILNNVSRESSRQFRKKRRNIRAKIEELENNSKLKKK